MPAIFQAHKIVTHIKAILFSGNNEKEVLSFIPENKCLKSDGDLIVLSIEGEEKAHPGSIIALGILGEPYIITQESFIKKYRIEKGDLLSGAEAVSLPSSIKGIKYTGDNAEECLAFLSSYGEYKDGSILIHSKWGDLTALKGDIISKYSQDDFAAIKPGIFAKTYQIDSEGSF